MFGWPGAASRMLPEHVEAVTLAHVDENVDDALAAVADAFPKPARIATIAALDPPPVPSGALDSYTLAAAIAAALPEHAVVVDEGATSSVPLYPALESAAPHSWLTLTGGPSGKAPRVRREPPSRVPTGASSRSRPTEAGSTRFRRCGRRRANPAT